MKDQSFTVVEAYPERPFLPFHFVSIHSEARAVGLDHLLNMRVERIVSSNKFGD